MSYTYSWGYFVNPSNCSVNAGGDANKLNDCSTEGVYCTGNQLDCPSLQELGVSISINFDMTYIAGTKFSLRIKGHNEGSGEIRIFVCEGDNCEFVTGISIDHGDYDIDTGQLTAPRNFDRIVVEIHDNSGYVYTDYKVFGVRVDCVIPNVIQCGSCETSCQSECEASCKTGCEVSCQEGCEQYCEASCEVSCQSTCERSCQAGCETSCQSDCEISCKSECETTCKASCEVSCQSECESTCKTGCESQSECGECKSKCENSTEGGQCDFNQEAQKMLEQIMAYIPQLINMIFMIMLLSTMISLLSSLL